MLLTPEGLSEPWEYTVPRGDEEKGLSQYVPDLLLLGAGVGLDILGATKAVEELN
jgi:hypothetical protein